MYRFQNKGCINNAANIVGLQWTGPLAWWLECSPMARETWVQSQVKSYQRLKKRYLMPPCSTLSIVRYGLRVKWDNTGKGVAPSPTSWCNSNQKGRIWVTLDYSHQLYFYSKWSSKIRAASTIQLIELDYNKGSQKQIKICTGSKIRAVSTIQLIELDYSKWSHI